ncbi:competence protein ComEC [Thermovibrio guaymasensis]|uniref:Competence protein ComEC n=1 Tax=Thermovibrio guaymasensis TaxID=240167 RepID=A0A420W8J0_9BACT|nr:ComEC/Rec2 family competence protein [Thermovibrio guaymasensis]RKQ63624.1 competence protein ComEC [Thermovibrio guaymasensis]
MEKHKAHIFFLCSLALTWKFAGSDYFPFLLTSTAILGGYYLLKFNWTELLPTTVPLLAVLTLQSLALPTKAPPKVMWVREYSDNYKVAVVEGWKWIRIKDGENVEVGDVVSEDGKVLVKGKGGSAALKRLRYKLYREIEEVVDYPVSSVAGASTLGIRFELSQSLKGYFVLSGLYHFLAISGLHVGIVIGTLAGFLKLIRFPKPLISASLMVLPLMPLTGLPPSAVRAYLFTFLVSLGVEEFRKISPIYLLGVVFLLTVLFGKFNLSAALSFSAVGGILLSLEGKGSKLEKSLKVSVAPMLFTLPIVLHVFGTVNLMSWITTVLAGFIFTPFLISVFLMEVTLYKVSLINQVVEFLGELFIRGTQISFHLTKWAIVHSEISLLLAGITYVASLLLILSGKVRFFLVPSALLATYAILNQTVISGKEIYEKGWKVNSFRFISTEGQRYKECKIHSSYVMPATRKLLYKNELIDERLRRFEKKK